MYQYFTALRALNDLGLYMEHQEPNLDHLTEEYSSTRAAAQAGINATESIGGQSAPCYRCGYPPSNNNDDDEEKTIIVTTGYREPYFWRGIPIHDYHTLAVSIPLTSGDAAIDGVIDFDTPVDDDEDIVLRDTLIDDVEPYCKIKAQELPTIASYSLELEMLDNNLNDLDYAEETVEELVLTYFSSYKYLVGHIQNNVETGTSVSCHITDISLE